MPSYVPLSCILDLYFWCFIGSVLGNTVVKWLAHLPHSKKVTSWFESQLNQEAFCVGFASSYLIRGLRGKELRGYGASLCVRTCCEMLSYLGNY